ncbi:Membrane dipeptidase (Peptidase family M19) [Stieleria neptunia]|uniref:Membrane dipeptidase (Peptidase family M19) n=1 Tax=Stieleria neptunia TaxID=2527979 RepID=A0A518HQG7_9BACT|nr:membrane dipeptidase [Stieleria neptunia]QDV43041.1 Membrane dipeptidase (Peptidase family M19) [Stieleria neptunia]
MKLIFDAHLDLSMNAMEWNRDLRRPVSEIRDAESILPPRMKGQAAGVVSLSDMRRGGIGLCVATQIAGCMKPRSFVANWESPSQAWAMTQAQLAWYREMEEQNQMFQIRDLDGLESHLKRWADPAAAANANAPVGYILSLEGADSIVTLDHLDRAWEYGLRALGPSHYGIGRYSMGHDVQGGLPHEGRELIRRMDQLGMILDATHLNDACFWEALDLFGGSIWASHQMCRALVDDPRQFSDAQIKAVIDRGGVLGAAFDVWMVVPGFVRGQSHPKQMNITLEDIANHIDHVCQLAGNADHCGLGSDLDGGFGNEQCPRDVETIADLQKLDALLAGRGYSDSDRAAIFHGNFVRVLRQAWG